jgi:hypothetical protein
MVSVEGDRRGLATSDATPTRKGSISLYRNRLRLARTLTILPVILKRMFIPVTSTVGEKWSSRRAVIVDQKN